MSLKNPDGPQYTEEERAEKGFVPWKPMSNTSAGPGALSVDMKIKRMAVQAMYDCHHDDPKNKID